MKDMPETVRPAVVDRETWLAARRALLDQEKALTRAQDAVAAHRRALPWVRVETEYVFATEAGPRSLADLFAGRGQLIVYHFMFAPDWAAGCASCSFLADHIDGARAHLAARDVELVCVSRAPLEALLAYRRRMGWRFPWASSGGTSFNHDFGASFAPEAVAAGAVEYNYARVAFPAEDAHGASVFVRGADGATYHTYSTYGRGVEPMVGAYAWLDLAPRGRDEDGLPWTMAWVRRHDEYDGAAERRPCHG